tara:strand:+ start:906 stop:2147 length:1242 start_codon:yes stop_codon:yes gene_type:complete
MNININILSTYNSEDYQDKDYTFNNCNYKIIKYNKNTLKKYESSDYDKFKELSKFRSIIVRDNRVMAISPSKSIGYDNFKNNFKPSDVYIEEFVDGTMINVFYDNINECWEIATKSTVGANILYFNDVKNYNLFNVDNNTNFNNTTFRSMFFDACKFNNFSIDSLDKKYQYSFVLQHPFNRIVSPITTPIIFLIKIYYIDNLKFPDINITEININEYATTPPYPFLNTTIKIPNKFTLDSYENLESHYSSNNVNFNCVGSMLYSNTGERSKIRNPNYEQVRKLRGNHPKLQYNYLSLKKENKIKEFLYYYPECSILFNKFKLLMYSYTNELFLNYISCFIRKEKPLKEYDFQYKVHMFNIHKKYITELKELNKVVDKKVVIDYINSLHPAQQMFVINYKFNSKNFENNSSMEE